jgi:hypothetical protein
VTAPSRATVAGQAYLELRRKARQDRRPVDELIHDPVDTVIRAGQQARIARREVISHPPTVGPAAPHVSRTARRAIPSGRSPGRNLDVLAVQVSVDGADGGVAHEGSQADFYAEPVCKPGEEYCREQGVAA